MTAPVTTTDCFEREKEIRNYVDAKVTEIYRYIDAEIFAQKESFDARIEKMEQKLEQFQYWLLGALIAMIGSLVAGMWIIVQIVSKV